MYHDSSYLLLPLTLDNSNTQKLNSIQTSLFVGKIMKEKRGLDIPLTQLHECKRKQVSVFDKNALAKQISSISNSVQTVLASFMILRYKSIKHFTFINTYSSEKFFIKSLEKIFIKYITCESIYVFMYQLVEKRKCTEAYSGSCQISRCLTRF